MVAIAEAPRSAVSGRAEWWGRGEVRRGGSGEGGQTVDRSGQVCRAWMVVMRRAAPGGSYPALASQGRRGLIRGREALLRQPEHIHVSTPSGQERPMARQH